jgi:hypothetical protein
MGVDDELAFRGRKDISVKEVCRGFTSKSFPDITILHHHSMATVLSLRYQHYLM